MSTIKLTPKLCSEIRKHARDFIGGFGMRIEIGQRIMSDPEDENGIKYYYNRYTPGDDATGDLFDCRDWEVVKGLEIEAIEGKVLLDFYVHDSEELKDNLLVEIVEPGIITQVWTTGTEPRDLCYTATVQS